MSERERNICGVVSHSGPNGEPLACGYPADHEGTHSWADLPTFPVGSPASLETTAQLINRTRWGASRGIVTTHDVVELGNALEEAERSRQRARHALEPRRGYWSDEEADAAAILDRVLAHFSKAAQDSEAEEGKPC